MPRLNPYEHLLSLNTGFDLIGKALGALSRQSIFHRKELARFEGWSEETRSSINSYIAGISNLQKRMLLVGYIGSVWHVNGKMKTDECNPLNSL